MSDLTGVLLLLIPAILPLIARVVELLRPARRHAIRWTALPPTSMLHPPEDVSGRLETTFNGNPIRNVTRFRFVLHNSGSIALDKDSIVSPLTWTAPGTILDARVAAVLPYSRLQIETEGRIARFDWDLFNPKCQVLIEILCDCELTSNIGCTVSEIRNVPNPKTRFLYHIDEEEIRGRIRENIARMSKTSRILYRENLVMWLSLYGHKLVEIYVAALASVFLFLVLHEVAGLQ